MTDLSPQAQAIVDAFHREVSPNYEQGGLAAALRALAKQYTFADTAVNVTEKVVLVDDVLKIATELENI